MSASAPAAVPSTEEPINRRSDHLVVLVATYNRVDQLRPSLESMLAGTRSPCEIIVVDGGSTDGTIEYVEAHPGLTLVKQGALLGAARSYNEVWRRVRSRFTCWLSDDTELVPGSLDLAVEILEGNARVGMVGLKMKDTIGAGKERPYMGALSSYGILTCNHGVLRTDLLRELGFFNESYFTYNIDPDLTASVLSAGREVVMTKQVSVLHHRLWAEVEGDAKIQRATRGLNNEAIYREKFRYLAPTAWWEKRNHLGWALTTRLERAAFGGSRQEWFGLDRQDVHNISLGRFISLADPLWTADLPYHLVQRIPRELLESPENPYRRLVDPAEAG